MYNIKLPNFAEKISQLEQQARDSSAHILERNKLIMSLEEKLAATSTHALESDLAIISNLLCPLSHDNATHSGYLLTSFWIGCLTYTTVERILK